MSQTFLKERLELSQLRGALSNMTKWNIETWTGSWAEKGH